MNTHSTQLVALLSKDLSLTEDESSGLQTDDHALLATRLKQLVAYLLDHDFNRLINACYRMDISETKLKEALNTAEPDRVPEEIANLILVRQQQKVQMRLKYST